MSDNVISMVAAGIVTFNPDIAMLKKNLEAVTKALKVIWIVDNGSKNIQEIKEVVDGFKHINGVTVLLIENRENYGIAAALNSLMQMGKKEKLQWILTLDQDSQVPGNIISANSEMLSRRDVGVISAVVNDRNIIHQSLEKESSKYSEVEKCITSASLTNITAWEKVGKFDEFLFIDEVDHEFCYRLRIAGYKILRNNEVVLSHAIGNVREVKFFGRWVAIYNHSAQRKYYQIRNQLYLYRKMHGKLDVRVWKEVFSKIIKVILYEKEKKDKVRWMIKGIIDGLRINVSR